MAGYYLAPLGEVLRGMLPLMAEVRRTVYYRITDLGRDVLAKRVEADGVEFPKGRAAGAKARGDFGTPNTGAKAPASQENGDDSSASQLSKSQVRKSGPGHPG